MKYHLKTCGFIWKCATCDKTYKERLSLMTHCTRHSHVLPVEAQRRTRTKAKKEDKKEPDNVQVMIFPVVMPERSILPERYVEGRLCLILMTPGQKNCNGFLNLMLIVLD